ncbi:MAG: hypothetical protein LBQ91_04795 [Oscillospiraceae bacterium]|jgi:hypothetical protein|nr:hypothetical protein [Oscillospiraceae bacterium]
MPGIKRFCFFSHEKRSRPFLVTFSGEAEKVTARRVGAFAVNRRAATSQFQTPHFATNRELFVPADRLAYQRTPTPQQTQSIQAKTPEERIPPVFSLFPAHFSF